MTEKKTGGRRERSREKIKREKNEHKIKIMGNKVTERNRNLRS
jgi:hypothetical protein